MIKKKCTLSYIAIGKFDDAQWYRKLIKIYIFFMISTGSPISSRTLLDKKTVLPINSYNSAS